MQTKILCSMKENEYVLLELSLSLECMNRSKKHSSPQKYLRKKGLHSAHTTKTANIPRTWLEHNTPLRIIPSENGILVI